MSIVCCRNPWFSLARSALVDAVSFAVMVRSHKLNNRDLGCEKLNSRAALMKLNGRRRGDLVLDCSRRIVAIGFCASPMGPNCSLGRTYWTVLGLHFFLGLDRVYWPWAIIFLGLATLYRAVLNWIWSARGLGLHDTVHGLILGWLPVGPALVLYFTGKAWFWEGCCAIILAEKKKTFLFLICGSFH